MDELACAAAAFAAGALLLHLASAIIAAARLRERRNPCPAFVNGPSVTILRTVCGVDPHDEATLRSSFELSYLSYEVLFCCAGASDPVVPLIERLIAQYPHVNAKLLIGEDRVSQNPKLNNLAKGWRAAAYGWIAMVDSNALMPRDYIQRLLETWQHDTGLVSAPPIGCWPATIWAELECAFLNTYQARWQYTADTFGYGFAQGKTMLWRRIDLEREGGVAALGAEPAEDAMATKTVRAQGLRVRLVDGAVEQPLGPRTAVQVWNRQVRWARLRRATFPAFYIPEVLTGIWPPLLSGVLSALAFDCDATTVATVFLALWIGAEAWLIAEAGWHFSWRSPLIWLLRDLLLPVLWMQSWLGSGYHWRGKEMTVSGDEGWRTGRA